jgi:predicted nucleic acid-binding protein
VLGGAKGAERVTISNLFTLVPYLPQTEAVWEEAVRFQWLARQKGITVPWSDALIATLAQKNKLRIYARDKHFEALAAVGLASLYIPGPGVRYTE